MTTTMMTTTNTTKRNDFRVAFGFANLGGEGKELTDIEEDVYSAVTDVANVNDIPIVSSYRSPIVLEMSAFARTSQFRLAAVSRLPTYRRLLRRSR